MIGAAAAAATPATLHAAMPPGSANRTRAAAGEADRMRRLYEPSPPATIGQRRSQLSDESDGETTTIARPTSCA
jgi:hypothetical protein